MSYTYKISAQNIGGERVIGTIPSEVAVYWLENHYNDFEEYYLSEGRDYDSDGRWNHIPEEYRLKFDHWYENNDIFHGDDCEFSDSQWIEVCAVEGNEQKNIYGERIYQDVVEIKHKKLKSKNTNVMEDLNPEMRQKLYPDHGDPELHVVYGKRVFKGSWDFETFTIDHKFDAAKLTAITETWAEEKVIAGFMYEDKHIKSEGCTDGIHKWDRAWIEDYLLD